MSPVLAEMELASPSATSEGWEWRCGSGPWIFSAGIDGLQKLMGGVDLQGWEPGTNEGQQRESLGEILTSAWSKLTALHVQPI